MVVDFVINTVAGARRTPGRLKTGGVPPKSPATIFISLSPSVFLGLQIVVQDVAASFSDALSRQPSSSSSSLRRLWLGVAAQASGTSLSDVSATQFPVHTKQFPSRSEEYRKVLPVQCESRQSFPQSQLRWFLRRPVSKSQQLQCKEWLRQKTVEISQSQYLIRAIQVALVVQTDPEDLERFTCPALGNGSIKTTGLPAGRTDRRDSWAEALNKSLV